MDLFNQKITYHFDFHTDSMLCIMSTATQIHVYVNWHQDVNSYILSLNFPFLEIYFVSPT